MIVYLVRHAASQSRRGLNYEEGYTKGLSVRGKLQARFLGSFLRRRGVDRVFSSPMQRAIATAQYIAQGKHIIVDERLVEYSPNKTARGLEYKSFKKMALADPSLRPANGESVLDAAERIHSFIQTLEQGSSAALVGHALAFQCYLDTYLHITDSLALASTTTLEVDGGEARVIAVNDTSYMPWAALKRFLKRLR